MYRFEQQLLRSVRESYRRYVTIGIAITVLLAAWLGSMDHSRLMAYFSKQTADFAKETLENESLKVQTQELARAVVQTVLNDSDVTTQAAVFLREAAAAPETQEALLKLTLHVLEHEESLKQLSALTVKVIAFLSTDMVSLIINS